MKTDRETHCEGLGFLCDCETCTTVRARYGNVTPINPPTSRAEPDDANWQVNLDWRVHEVQQDDLKRAHDLRLAMEPGWITRHVERPRPKHLGRVLFWSALAWIALVIWLAVRS